MHLIFLIAMFHLTSCFNIYLQENLTTFQTAIESKTDSKVPSFFGYNLHFRSEQSNSFSLMVGSPKPQPGSNENIQKCSVDYNTPSSSSLNNSCSVIPPPFVESNYSTNGLSLVNRGNDDIVACYPSKVFDCSPRVRLLPGLCYKTSDDGRTWSNVSNNHEEFCVNPNTLDLMFLLDGSSTVGAEDFEIVKSWVKNISVHFNISSGSTQIGVILYSSYLRSLSNQPFIRTEIRLGETRNPEVFNASVDRINFIGGQTDTSKALNITVEEFKTSSRYTFSNNTKVLVLVTDGKATDSKQLPATAEYVRSLGIKTYAVGVGEADDTELRIIATGDTNSDKDVYYVNDFDALSGIADVLKDRILSFTLEGSSIGKNFASQQELAEKGFSTRLSLNEQIDKD